MWVVSVWSRHQVTFGEFSLFCGQNFCFFREALRLVMEAKWDSAVEDDVIDDLEAVLEDLFNSSLVSVEYFYPVHANATLKNVPLQATNENLEEYISSAIFQILSLKSYEVILRHLFLFVFCSSEVVFFSYLIT